MRETSRFVKEKPDAAMSFESAGSIEAEPAAIYDAIFAMAVLRHGSLGLPGVTRCDHLIRFDEFARAVEDFKALPESGRPARHPAQ
jgi:hypothetical protein